MQKRTAVLVAAILGAFGAGVAVATWLARPQATPPPDERPPRVLVEPSSISLLPDASLRFDPPPPPRVDAGPQ